MIFGKKRKIALFGGSFNPPHIGHTAICKWLFDEKKIDEVWVIPCFIHPFNKELAPFEHRMAMCRLALSKHQLPIDIVEVEEELGDVSHTLRTVEHLKKEYPKFQFSFVTGADVEKQQKEWYEIDPVKDLVEIITVPRGPDSPIPDISSTEIREKVAAGEPYRDLVETEVAVYITTKGLYR